MRSVGFEPTKASNRLAPSSGPNGLESFAKFAYDRILVLYALNGRLSTYMILVVYGIIVFTESNSTVLVVEFAGHLSLWAKCNETFQTWILLL